MINVSERFVQPANDQCNDAVELFEDVSYEGSNIEALGNTGSSCGYYFDLYDVWHVFNPAETKDYLISLCDSDFDTTLSVYDACDGTEVACNDDSCERQSSMVVSFTQGQSYRIRVAGYDGAVGNYLLTVTEAAPIPINDECSFPITLLVNEPYTGSTESATGSVASTCSDSDVRDVWFEFTAPVSRNYEIGLCQSQFDTTLSVYDGCGGTELVCNDDACEDKSRVSIYLEEMTTYLIRVAGYRGAFGFYTILINSDCVFVDEPAAPYPDDLSLDIELDPVLAWNSGTSIMQNSPENMMMLKGIYGTDDRMDEYQILNSQLKAVGDSTVALIPVNDLTNNGDGTYSIPSSTLADYYLANYGRPLCSDEPFINQPDPAVCTGFLVAPNMVATTGHCVADSYDCSNIAYVFGFKMLNESTPVTTFDESEIYFCDGIVARLETEDSDWALVRLDREVLNHAPLNTRRSGLIPDDQDLAVIGHTLGLPRKYADNAWVQDNTPQTYFSANLDTYIGSSGSPVINVDTYQVEGVLFAGNPDFVEDIDCDRSAQCPDTGCPAWEKVTRVTEFSDYIPVYDVYLGTSPDQMQLVSYENSQPWCQISELQCGTNYYWQVIAKTNCSQLSGPVWNFSTVLAGDFDKDCDVDINDYAAFASAWMDNPCDNTNNFCNGKDIDKLGSVDNSDFVIFLSHWLENINP